MVYRHSWLAGFASIAFSFWLLQGLVRPTSRGTNWQFIVLAGLTIGVIVTWTARSYRLRAPWIAALNVGAFVLAAARFAAPEHTVLIFPTRESLRILTAELTKAIDWIQHGVEPILPITGLVIILTALFWLLGAVLVWGLTTAHPFVGVIPPLVVALQLATIDRQPSGLIPVLVFVTLVAGTVMAVNADEHDRGAGRMAHPGRLAAPASGKPSPTAVLVLGATIIGAVFAVGLVGRTVPADGVVTWRTPSGLTGDYFGSVAYNPFVEIQSGLVSQSPTPVFRATVEGDVPADEVYFRLLTLDTYNGGQWSAPRALVYPLEEEPWEDEDQAYFGPTSTVDADVFIEALSMDWLPAPYAPVAVEAEDGGVQADLRIRRSDASLRYAGGFSYTGLEYAITADIPQIDPLAVMTTATGALSPLFATAAQFEEPVPTPTAAPTERLLADHDRYVELPEDLDPRIAAQALQLTALLATPFEKGLALEKWFRDSGGFSYDTTVDTGHGSDVLATWLFDDDETNPDYRRGYCEHFATSMAVMARTVDLPSRVVLGFTPGELIGPNEVVVRDRNAHAWVELWIPTQGWVRFDPTPRSDGVNPITYESVEDDLGFELTAYLGQIPEPERPDVENLGGGAPLIAEDDPEFLFTPGVGGSDVTTGLPGWIWFAIPAIVMLGLFLGGIPAVKWYLRRRRMRRLESGDISAAWEEIVSRLSDLGEPPNPAVTPAELATSVDDAMTPLARVYGRMVYGDAAEPSDGQIRTATESLDLTSSRLNTRFSTGQRFRAWYRVGTIIPRRKVRKQPKRP